MDYEESEIPYLVVGSLERAEEMRDKMIDELKGLKSRMEHVDFNEDGWHQKGLRNEGVKKSHKWIYGIDLSDELEDWRGIDPDCVDIQALPYYE